MIAAGIVCAATVCGVPVQAALPSSSATDCEHLLQQFDVAWNAHRNGQRAAAARKSREAGETACREGRYSEGVHHLRHALHDLGLKPVKRVAPANNR